MKQEKLVDQIRQLKRALEEIEKRLTEGTVPFPVLEDFKAAIDHIRMTVWAILSTPQANQYELASSIVRFRLKRSTQMCQQIVMDINSSEITVDSPELQEFHAALKNTLERIDRLYQSGL